MGLVKQLILVVGATDENSKIIKTALNKEFRLHFSSTRSDADKYLAKNHTNIFSIIVDTLILNETAVEMIKDWYSDLRFQLLPLTAIYKNGDEKMRKAIVEAGTITLLASPITTDYISAFVKSIDRRIKYSETRIAEAYEDMVKTNRNKLFIVSNAIDASIMFLKIDGDELFFEFSNKKALDIFGNVNYQDLLAKFDNEDSAKIIKILNQAKGDYEHHSALVKYFDDSNNDHIFEFVFTQIMNIENNEALKFVLCIFDRTLREKVLTDYKENNDMLTSILDNINGGICVFRIEDKNVISEYISKGIYRIGGYSENDKSALNKLLPTESQLLLTKKTLENANNLVDGQNAEPFNFKTRVITSDFKERHISINVSVYKKNDHEINVRALVTDDTDEYNYQRMLKKAVEYDSDTDLFNNNKFIEATEKLFRSNDERNYKLMIIRIYKFDEIRSFFGKDKALELLKVVSTGIKKNGKSMLRGRVDTKDFAVSFNSAFVNEKKFMEELDNYVKDNFPLYQVKLYYGVYNVDDVYESVDALIIQTKFGVKEIEGNAIKNHIYCDARMKKRIIENDNISNEMKKALDNNEFEIFLQPVFDLKSRKIISAEALTRWHHPKRGYIAPAEYIPIFEENGFIVNIDMFVWENACKIIRNWLDSGIKAVPISVNVSRIDLFSIDFYSYITKLVQKYDIPIEYLRLEITESAFVLNETEVIEIVDRLRKFGFKILMDDFGSGYSSLNSLKFINIDILKIDMDLVRGIEESIRQSNILKSVINLGNTLELEMICEGVETENQAKFVEENGCNKAQGWLFSKAIPLKDFTKKLSE